MTSTRARLHVTEALRQRFPEIEGDPVWVDGEATSKETWRHRLMWTEMPPPVRLNVTQYLNLTSSARNQYDRDRLAHNRRTPTFQTPTFRRIQVELTELLDDNAYAGPGVKIGRVISGAARTGKSTAVYRFARELELDARKADPSRFTREGRECCPVVLVQAPEPPQNRGGVHPKAVAERIGHWINLPTRKYPNMPALTVAIAETLQKLQTEMLIIDDVNRLAGTGAIGEANTDFIKSLMSLSGITVVLAGVDLESTNLLADAQTAGRFQIIPAKAMQIGTKLEQREWRGLIEGLEKNWQLYGHVAGTLAENHWEYLWTRSRGLLGTLVPFLTRAAKTALLQADGDPKREAVSLEVLESLTTGVPAKRSVPKRARA